MHPEVAETIAKAAKGTERAQDLIDPARQEIAEMVGCRDEEILFTTGTTASIETGIRLLYRFNKAKSNRIITCRTEHIAVLETCQSLTNEGAEICYVDVDPEGIPDLAQLRSLCSEPVNLVCIMAANNESGSILPVAEIGEICATYGVCFFSDACQYIGKVRCDAQEINAGCMAFGSHKMYGPKGIGALFVARELSGAFATHAYTPDPVLAAGFGRAAKLFNDEYWEINASVSKLRGYFEHQVLEVPGLRINGSTRNRLYNTSNICFPNPSYVEALIPRFQFSHNLQRPSHVLAAMGLSEHDNRCSARFSFGRYNTPDEVKLLVESVFSVSTPH